MSFSLRTLLGCFVIASVVLTIGKRIHDRYYINKLNHYIMIGDGCSVVELLRYGQENDFPVDWADEILVSAATKGDYITLRSFSYTTNLDRKLGGEHTPLMVAAKNGHFNAVKFLLVQEVETRVTDSTGATAFDLALSSNHPEVAALISLSESELWGQVLRTDATVYSLFSEGACNRNAIEELLSSDKYASLVDLRTDDPIVGDETGWYRVNERVMIGTLNSNSEFIWVVDGKRVDGVDYFYPPSRFE